MSVDSRTSLTPQAEWYRQVAGLVGWLALCFAVAAVGGWVTLTSVSTWYPTLQKPSWNPPSWVFGPVWTTLYAMMAVAAWLVWRRHDVEREARETALWTFSVQLALNLGWSCAFFGLRAPGLAFCEILVLWAAIALTFFHFQRLSRTAGWLLVPYLAWTTFAALLNFAILMLNR